MQDMWQDKSFKKWIEDAQERGKKPAQEVDPEENSSGKQKPDSFVSRLPKKPTGNTIRNNAGFMVMENGENGENEEATPDVSENRTKPKKRKLSERLQDPIISLANILQTSLSCTFLM